MPNTLPASLDLFRNNVPLMDVRAPVEFNQGAFPNATNRPLLDDRQREAVGIRYQEAGQDAAIALGLELATDAIRAERLAAWSDFIRRHPNGALYCFRGGLRSKTTQQWLREHGLDYPLIVGGYKALRRLLLDELHHRLEQHALTVLAGPTGSGKTEVIQRWPHSLDLEGRAKHRGSAFGRTFSNQPGQIDWENAITVDWLHTDPDGDTPVLVEDESRLIGRIHVFPELLARIQNAPLLVLEAPLAERIERIREDYLIYALNHFRQHGDTDPWDALADWVQANLHRIRKRLGGLRHQQLHDAVPEATRALRRDNDWLGFDTIIESLLTDYYDPMYHHQLQRRDDQIRFRGTQAAVLDHLSRTVA